MIFGNYGRVLEGSTGSIGIEEDTTSSYYGRCRLCGFRGTRQIYEQDAAEELTRHRVTPEHREKLISAAAKDFEEKLLA